MSWEVKGVIYPGSHGSVHIIRAKKSLNARQPKKRPFAFFRKVLAEGRAGKCNDNALACIDKREYKDAIQWLDKALRREPQYLPAHINRGVCHFRQGKNLAAVLDFKRAIRIDPYHTNAHYNLGILFANRGCYNLSLQELNGMFWNDMADVSAFFNMGNVYGLKREYGTAVTYYDAVLAIDPEHKIARRNLEEALSALAERQDKGMRTK